MTRTLIAGIGNIFLGDDAFGVEVVRHLLEYPLPPGVCVIDFGIRGVDLTYALMEGYDWTILVDAAPRGLPPGTLSVIEPDLTETSAEQAIFDPHSIEPVKVLQLARQMGADLKNIFLVACEPSHGDLDEMEMKISPQVKAAIPEAIKLIASLLEKIYNPIGGTHHESLNPLQLSQPGNLV